MSDANDASGNEQKSSVATVFLTFLRLGLTSFGGPIAHGFLSLSLLSYLNAQTAIVPENLAMGINYGSDKIRYLMPVRIGNRIRSKQTVLEVSEKKPGQWLMKTAVTVEVEGEDTPALIAEILSMMVVA